MERRKKKIAERKIIDKKIEKGRVEKEKKKGLKNKTPLPKNYFIFSNALPEHVRRLW